MRARAQRAKGCRAGRASEGRHGGVHDGERDGDGRRPRVAADRPALLQARCGGARQSARPMTPTHVVLVVAIACAPLGCAPAASAPAAPPRAAVSPATAAKPEPTAEGLFRNGLTRSGGFPPSSGIYGGVLWRT